VIQEVPKIKKVCVNQTKFPRSKEIKIEFFPKTKKEVKIVNEQIELIKKKKEIINLTFSSYERQVDRNNLRCKGVENEN
jgi:hypothetical protein